MIMKNNTIIPEQQYVGGLVRRTNTILPIALMTPYGTDKAAKKRIDTLNRNIKGWTKGGTNTFVIDNDALSGFRLTGKVYSGTGSDYWVIEDPRGFGFEITSDNLNELVMNTTIENGEILSPCVWGRRRSNNVLISIHSDEYKLAISNTNAANSKASWRDVKAGDTILLRSNVKGVWLGKFYPIFHSYYGVYKASGPISSNEVQVSNRPYHVIYVTNTNNSSHSHSLHIVSSPQLAKILNTSNRLDPKQAEQMANDYINDTTCGEVSNLYRRIVALSVKPDVNFTIETVPVDLNTEQDLSALLEQGSVNPYVFVNSDSGAFGRLKMNAPTRVNVTDKFYVINYDKSEFENNRLCRTLEKSKSRSYHSSNAYWNELHTVYKFNQTDQFYILIFNLDTTLKNNIKMNFT